MTCLYLVHLGRFLSHPEPLCYLKPSEGDAESERVAGIDGHINSTTRGSVKSWSVKGAEKVRVRRRGEKRGVTAGATAFQKSFCMERWGSEQLLGGPAAEPQIGITTLPKTLFSPLRPKGSGCVESGV